MWAKRRIQTDLRLLPPACKLSLLLYAPTGGVTVERLAELTGMPKTETRKAYKILKDAGLLEQAARVFYGEAFDEAVAMGKWSE